MDIESADVVRLIEQFLKEHNLHKTLSELQNETGVSLNTVDNIDALQEDVIQGRWDAVLASIEQAHVPHDRRIDLYEQIIVELAEQSDIGPARALLRQTEPMEIMRKAEPDRYLNLERILSRTSFDSKEVSEKDRVAQRRAIAAKLAEEVGTAPPSRLLTLLGQSAKWQQAQGLIPDNAPFDLFLGKSRLVRPAEDKVPHRLLATVRLPKKQHPTSLAFSTDGMYLVTGSADGFVELWHYMTGKLANEFKYQNDAPMMMEEAVTSLAFGHKGELVCSGAKDGRVKVWKVKSGSCIKRFPAAHSRCVTCVAFSKDDTQVLSGGLDNVLRIHGLKSGKILKEFHGHTAPITSAIFDEGMRCVVSASEDGTVRIWDATTASCLHSVVPGGDQGLAAPTTHTLLAIPGSLQFAVCTKSPNIYIMTLDGSVQKTLTATSSTCREFLAAIVSPKGTQIQAVSDTSVLHSFDIETGSLRVVEPKVPISNVLGMAGHPALNVAAFFSTDRRVPVWTA
ncbi:hypothetical protein GGF46_005114 [Coemansia sp. RSA 552]|nr:hypothetical protein GGF46_005114 [Coemansia sp. RSA 552]